MNTNRLYNAGLQFVELLSYSITSQVAEALSTKKHKVLESNISIASTTVVTDLGLASSTYRIFVMLSDAGELGYGMNYVQDNSEKVVIGYTQLWMVSTEKDQGLPANFSEIIDQTVDNMLRKIILHAAGRLAD